MHLYFCPWLNLFHKSPNNWKFPLNVFIPHIFPYIPLFFHLFFLIFPIFYSLPFILISPPPLLHINIITNLQLGISFAQHPANPNPKSETHVYDYYLYLLVDLMKLKGLGVGSVTLGPLPLVLRSDGSSVVPTRSIDRCRLGGRRFLTGNKGNWAI